MQQITDVCVCKRFFALFISLLFKSLEAQCATRYHFSQPETPSIINIRTRTVNTIPEKKRKNFEKVIQFSDFLSFKQNVSTFFAHYILLRVVSEQIIANGTQIFIVSLVTNWWKTYSVSVRTVIFVHRMCVRVWLKWIDRHHSMEKFQYTIPMQNHTFLVFVVAANDHMKFGIVSIIFLFRWKMRKKVKSCKRKWYKCFHCRKNAPAHRQYTQKKKRNSKLAIS